MILFVIVHRPPELPVHFSLGLSPADYSTIFSQAKCVHALKGLAMPGATRFCEIALAESHRLLSTLVAAPVLFVRAVVSVAKIGRTIISPLVQLTAGI